MATKTLDFEIRSTAQLDSATQTKAALEEAIATIKATRGDASLLEAELAKVNVALGSTSAAAVRQVDALHKSATAMRQLGVDASGIDAQIGKVHKSAGLLPQPGQLQRGVGAVADFAKEVPGLGGLGSVASTLAEGPAGLAVSGGKAALKVATEGVEEYAKAEENFTKLDTALAQTGNLTDETRKKFHDLAARMQEATGVADDEWIGVLTRLTHFGARPETIGMDLKAVENLAGLLGGDVTEAANVYSEALQGNYESFRKYGIEVNEASSQTEKLKQLQEDLAKRGSGQLAASNNTLAGQWRTLKNGASDVLEAIGRFISQTGILQTVLYGLGKSLSWFAGLIGGVPEKVEGLKNAVESTTESMSDQKDAAGELSKGLKSVEDEYKGAADNAARLRREQDALLDSQTALKLSEVDLQETQLKAQGRLTPLVKAQLDAKRAEIKISGERQKADRAVAGARDDLKNKEKEQADFTAGIDKAVARRDAADAAVESFTNRGVSLARKNSVTDDLAAATKERLNARTMEEYNPAVAKVEALEKKLKDINDFEKALKEQSAAHEGLSQKLDENDARGSKLIGAVDTAKNNLKIAETNRARIGVESVKADTESRAATDQALQNDRQSIVEAGLAHPKEAGQLLNQFLPRAAERIAKAQRNGEDLGKVFNQLADLLVQQNKSDAKHMQDLEQRLANLKSQFANTRTP